MAEKLTFHQAMMRLDEIVTKLNSNQLELEEAMKLFEEGLKLSRQCDNQLKKFENKMNTLLVDEGDKTNE
ncbi:exodeoxyribonuclease VII small subunit [uncultured Dubosiella sp.]|jgi:exodeoxyribonuclease VII small subunit|uniref:exodeoxyribonuclease VII small subunit n=1 Tax=uncultured Dubosiella sp. TaxID=1937011 RepID=UPI000EBA7311|nr:exodeoxyribonuclease VII small subunit [uncultured Dubosiella sp.]GJM57717.1 exodeoxyribonuclease 7 small subunit [Erysipelotrichaceae bacterium OPF54]HAM31740.1 exodeoxyribonuclease VII small subunit [Erysipelotrichaceae bacterium]